MITVRKITDEDIPTVQGWAEARELGQLILLSPHGFLALDDDRPILAIWGYLLLDVPIVQLDNLISRPGSTIFELREAWREIVSTVSDWAQRFNADTGHSYRFLRAFVEPRIARETGWETGQKNLTCICHVIP